MYLDQNSFEKFLNKHEIEAICAELGKKISQDYAGKQIVLVCVLKGAIIFLADLIRHIKVENEVEFVRLSSYGKGRESTGTVTILKDISSDIRGKHVLIV